MSALAVNETLDFIALKEFLNVTDGNLATHIKKLEKEGFIGVKKTFIDNKPNTRYSMTPDGKKAFGDYLNVMEEIIKAQK
jgi:DNA-binding MarR family transcriptional regulator